MELGDSSRSTLHCPLREVTNISLRIHYVRVREEAYIYLLKYSIVLRKLAGPLRCVSHICLVSQQPVVYPLMMHFNGLSRYPSGEYPVSLNISYVSILPIKGGPGSRVPPRHLQSSFIQELLPLSSIS